MYRQVIPLVVSHLVMKKCFMLQPEKPSPFEEVNLDLKAGEHGSPEDQKRRNSGPPQLQILHTLHTVREKEKEPSFDAARFRASVETDPANDLDLKHRQMVATESYHYLMELPQ